MPELDVAVARWLVSHTGCDAVATATRSLDDGADDIAVVTELRRQGLDPPRTAAVCAAATARRRARARWVDADQLLFTRESLEQASDPEVARWRAQRFADRDVWDLCAGVGGDTLALARRATMVSAVDIDPARLVLLAHNAACRGVEVAAIPGDALTVTVPAGAALHADPARRRGMRRVRHLADHVPPVPALLSRHGAAAGSGVVLSPAVDTTDPGFPRDAEVEFIQLGSELVEASVWLGDLRQAGGVVATATLLPDGHQRVRRGPRPPRLAVGQIGDHLVEIAPAAVRARLHDDIGEEIGARRIALRRALLTCDGVPPPSPWYRARAVLTVQPARPRALRSWLRATGVGPVEVVLHGLERDPQAWWRELGRPERGPGGVRIELTRLDAGAVAIVTDDGPSGRQRVEHQP